MTSTHACSVCCGMAADDLDCVDFEWHVRDITPCRPILWIADPSKTGPIPTNPPFPKSIATVFTLFACFSVEDNDAIPI